MITINSFIKKDNKIINSIDNIENYFILFDNVNDLEFIEDYDYIEGAIVLDYNGCELLGFKYWDLIDQFWSYTVDALSQLLLGEKEVSFYLPDQPIKIEIRYISNEYVLLTIDGRKYSFKKDELFIALCKGAKHFWRIIENCSIETMKTQSEYQLKKIQEVLDGLSK